MGLAAAMKALKKAEIMKEKVQAPRDLLNDNETWILQQQLLGSYRHVLLLDLEYALDKKVEQDIWNHAFKSFIGSLQSIAKDKKHPKRPEGQAMLNWCLEAAAGFYVCLLQEVCSAFDLDLPFRRHGGIFGLSVPSSQTFPKDAAPSKRSCYYVCQYCLVHLGDIARYRNQNRQAEMFYRYAVICSPTGGQPYNQLALLEASRGDKVSEIFHYVRAVALSHPFAAAATNLSRTFERHSDETVKMDGHSKLSSHEYSAGFLKLHGLLHSHAELECAEKLMQILTTSLTAHIATESLSGWKLVQMMAVNMFALQRIDGDGTPLSPNELTQTEIRVQTIISHFMAGCLNAFLLPVYTIKREEPLLEFFAMPAIKITLEWIRHKPEILQSTGFNTRRQIWPSLCRLLNQLQAAVKDFPLDKYCHVPLPEDRDLQGFLPLEKSMQNLNFRTDDLKTDTAMLNKLRAARMINFGTWMTTHAVPLVTKSQSEENTELVFEPVGRPEPPGDLIREFEELSLNKKGSPAFSDLSGASTPDSSASFALGLSSILSQETPQEKKGILKSDLPDKKPEKKSSTRASKNVALASIMNQKMADEVKQVTFQTPSPTKDNKAQKVSPAHKKTVGKPTKPEPKTIQPKPSDTLSQQQKLMEVLTEKEKSKKSAESQADDSQRKQQVLSSLFDEKKLDQQPPMGSGLLNLSKQQQHEMLAASNQPRPQQSWTAGSSQQQTRQQSNARASQPAGQQRVVEKMEAARKEYEDAMFVLQQQKQVQQGMMNYAGEAEGMRFDRPPPFSGAPPPQVFVPLNQPMMGMPAMSHMPTMSPMAPMQTYAFNMQPNLMFPWQDVDQPPMPPQSWWNRLNQPPPHMVQQPQGREPPGYRAQPQPLSTYSLFSNPMNPENDPNMHLSGRLGNQQSFWSGPGPSPLERLLEQQKKQMKDSDPNT